MCLFARLCACVMVCVRHTMCLWVMCVMSLISGVEREVSECDVVFLNLFFNVCVCVCVCPHIVPTVTSSSTSLCEGPLVMGWTGWRPGGSWSGPANSIVPLIRPPDMVDRCSPASV